MNRRIPKQVIQLGRIFAEAGYECHLVGGAVRDLFLRRRLTDFDIATNATPEQVSGLFRRVIPTGIKHGTVTVLYQSGRFEVTTYRNDGIYSDGRRPDTVSFSPSIEEDLKRRDFTINGMAYNLGTSTLIDPHGGRNDLRRRIIRAIGNPVERFDEDGLRPLRACRFAAQLGFDVDATTASAIPESLERVRSVSSERIREELIRIVQAENVVSGFELMRDTKLLQIILPELDQCIGVIQRERHCFDLFYHSLYTCQAAPAADPGLRLAALLHDVGKTRTAVRNDRDELRFPNHDRESADMARLVMHRLKFSNALTDRVCHLVRHHMFDYQTTWGDPTVRRLIARVGRENIPDLITLRRADQIGRCKEEVSARYLGELMARVNSLIQSDQAFTISDLAISGQDLMTDLGLPPGPNIGVILRFLLEAVLDDPGLNDKARLLNISRRFYSERINP